MNHNKFTNYSIITRLCTIALVISTMMFAIPAIAQETVIKGTVVDQKGLSVIGASIFEKGTKNGTITDIDGKFQLKGKKGTEITISCIGYATLNTVVTQLSGNIFKLKEDTMLLEEVVVVGMGTQKRNSITAAVATLKDDDFATRAVTDATSVLQGNVAGLNFSTDAVSGGVGGEIGADIKFNIRGIGSINGGSPYVLVDGVEQSLQNVNPADIESISVLKDASASAVYGARAAYGVVLVTTKSGKTGKSIVNYKGTIGFSSPINMPRMMNSLEFAYFNNEIYENGGASSGVQLINDKTIDLIKGFMKNPYSEEFPGVLPNINGDDWAGVYYNQFANTDWFKYYFKEQSIRHSHNLSFRGGSDKVKYYTGLGYTYQDGLLDHLKDNLEKYNLNTKLSFKAKPWLKFNVNNNMTLQMIKRPMANQMMLYNRVGSHKPTTTTKLPVDSEYNLPAWNEMVYLKRSSFHKNRLSNALTLSTIITPLENWNINIGMKTRLDIENNNLKMSADQKYETPDGKLKYASPSGQRQGYFYPGIRWKNMYFGSYSRGSLFNYYLSPSISTSYMYEKNGHFIKGMGGFQMELKEDSHEYMYKDGMLSQDIFSFDNASGNVIAGEARNHWSTMGYFAKLNYNYKNIYFLEVSGRYDGSSRFAKGNRWGLFPSFSAGYDISRANYFKKLELPISQLKIRVSYGRLGNQNGAGLYDYIAQMPLDAQGTDGWLLPGIISSTPQRGTIAYTPKMVSPFITWEKVDNANLGLDFMGFSNRLSITADVYQRTTRDMIGPADAIPALAGISTSDRAMVNNATLRNRGWELSVSWHDSFKNGISYGLGFNVFNYEAVITKYNNPEGIINNNHTGLPINKGYYEGMNVGEIWGYTANDLFLSNREIDSYIREVDMSALKTDDLWRRGDLKFIDYNHDGKINGGNGTLSDHGDLHIIGNTTPKYSFGINFNFGYKGFEIAGLLQGVAKRDFPISGSTYMFGGYGYNFKEHLDHFSTQNPNGYLPRLTGWKNDKDFMVNTGYNTTRYLLNAAYMRLKNLTISYTLPKKLMNKWPINNLKIFATCDNLFTISKLPKQFDPETLNQVNWMAGGDAKNVAPGLTSPMKQNGNGMVYPLNRTMVFGIDLTF